MIRAKCHIVVGDFVEAICSYLNGLLPTNLTPHLQFGLHIFRLFKFQQSDSICFRNSMIWTNVSYLYVYFQYFFYFETTVTVLL